jgi:hypothetical protein
MSITHFATSQARSSLPFLPQHPCSFTKQFLPTNSLRCDYIQPLIPILQTFQHRLSIHFISPLHITTSYHYSTNKSFVRETPSQRVRIHSSLSTLLGNTHPKSCSPQWSCLSFLSSDAWAFNFRYWTLGIGGSWVSCKSVIPVELLGVLSCAEPPPAFKSTPQAL